MDIKYDHSRFVQKYLNPNFLKPWSIPYDSTDNLSIVLRNVISIFCSVFIVFNFAPFIKMYSPRGGGFKLLTNGASTMGLVTPNPQTTFLTKCIFKKIPLITVLSINLSMYFKNEIDLDENSFINHNFFENII